MSELGLKTTSDDAHGSRSFFRVEKLVLGSHQNRSMFEDLEGVKQPQQRLVRVGCLPDGNELVGGRDKRRM